MTERLKALEHEYIATRGLWCIDRNPAEVDYEWIKRNAFQLRDYEGILTKDSAGAYGKQCITPRDDMPTRKDGTPEHQPDTLPAANGFQASPSEGMEPDKGSPARQEAVKT